MKSGNPKNFSKTKKELCYANSGIYKMRNVNFPKKERGYYRYAENLHRIQNH